MTTRLPQKAMSVQIDWTLLDAELALSCQAFLNSAFAAASRPSFLGDLLCDSFTFGETCPDIELVDVRDIYNEFLEADEAAEAEAAEISQAQLALSMQGEGMARSSSAASWMERERRISPVRTPSIRSAYGAVARLVPVRPGLMQRSATAPLHPGYFDHRPHPLRHGTADHLFPPSPPPEADLPDPHGVELENSFAPSLQLHFRIAYAGTLRIGLRTTLLVNHPSPSFLALPATLTVTALAFRGVLVCAYEGSKKRLHLSLLDPGPASAHSPHAPAQSGGGGQRSRPAERLLTDLVCESEVGQADKHVLRNVGKVEKFVLDVVRGALEVHLFASWSSPAPIEACTGRDHFSQLSNGRMGCRRGLEHVCTIVHCPLTHITITSSQKLRGSAPPARVRRARGRPPCLAASLRSLDRVAERRCHERRGPGCRCTILWRAKSTLARAKSQERYKRTCGSPKLGAGMGLRVASSIKGIGPLRGADDARDAQASHA